VPGGQNGNKGPRWQMATISKEGEDNHKQFTSGQHVKVEVGMGSFTIHSVAQRIVGSSVDICVKEWEVTFILVSMVNSTTLFGQVDEAPNRGVKYYTILRILKSRLNQKVNEINQCN
jgi:hypothetical protein